MAGTITTAQHNLVVDGVTEIVVTTIEQDISVGDYARDVRFYGLDAGGNTVLLVQVKARAASHDDIELTAPASEY